jgi:tetratricopeptide (TPR) repeat protein
MNGSAQQITDRKVRVFVSSTFRDMQAERDHLVKFVFPQLRKLCESRGVTWGEVDLRWGITDEEAAEGTVLPLCLEEIQRCRPYFLGLLGERYGWVPQSIPAALFERQPWLHEYRTHSVTELEIIHGVLRDEEMHGHAYFYFRDPSYLDRLPPNSDRADFVGESPKATAKLGKLKQRIRHAQAKQICELRENYHDPEELGQWILEDFTKLIGQLFPEDQKPDPVERERLNHEVFALNLARVYVGRQEYIDRLDAHVAGDGPPLVVLGESGIGKSALLANWILNRSRPATLNHQPSGDFALIHFIGVTPDSAAPARLLRRIMSELKRCFPDQLTDEVPTQPDKIREEFPRWLVRITGLDRIVLILDGLNQLEDRNAALDIGWLPEVFPPNCRLILSTLPGRSLDATRRRQWPELVVQPLTVLERRQLLEKFLGQFSKKLQAPDVKRITTAEQTANPLFLRAMLDELRQFGEHERMGERIVHYLAARDPKELYNRICKRWEQDYGADLVRQSFSLIWAARRGLSEAELLDLLGTGGQPLLRANWMPFYLAIEASLTQRSGLLTFSHAYLRTASYEAYILTAERQHQIHRRLADYFARRVLQGTREVEEIPWQLACAEEWQRLYTLLVDLGFLYVTYLDSSFDVLRYWGQIETHTDLNMATAYQTLAAAPHSYDLSVVEIVASLLIWGHSAEALKLYGYLATHYRQSDARNELQSTLLSQAMIRHRQGELDAALGLLKEQEQLCREMGNRRDLAASLAIQGQILRDRGELDTAMTVLMEQEQICRDLNEDYWLASSLGSQGTILQIRGDWDRALALHQEQERLCRELGEKGELQAALGNQATIHHRRGELDTALVLYRQEAELCRAIGDKVGLAASLGGQAMILREKGDFDGAMILHKQEEQVFRDIGHKRGLAASLGNQAAIPLKLGDLEKASLLLVEQEHICRELDDKVGLVASLANQALIARQRRDPSKALLLLDEMARLCCDLGDTRGLVNVVNDQAGILQQCGDLDNAMVLHQLVEKLCRRLGDLNGLQHCLRNQGLILQTRGDLDGAMRLQKEAERICRESGNMEGIGTCLVNQALVLAQRGQAREALAMAEQASQLALGRNYSALTRQVNVLLNYLQSQIS